MSEAEFRKLMNTASRANALCVLEHGSAKVVALGLDSGRGVAVLFKPGGQYEVPLAELSAPPDE